MSIANIDNDDSSILWTHVVLDRDPNMERAVVSSAVILTGGIVVVGPNNTAFHPHPQSKIWQLKDTSCNMTIEIKVSSFGPFAGVFLRSHTHKFLPVTLKTMWNYVLENKPSGIRLVAFIFYQLQHALRLNKSDLEPMLQEE